MFQDKCLAKMREFQTRGITIVLVTHNLELVEGFCQRAALLHAGSLVSEGDPHEVVQHYHELTMAHA
jgi:ABC-type polysaccharide/polyol phosphate transport system ATPase subunit